MNVPSTRRPSLVLLAIAGALLVAPAFAAPPEGKALLADFVEVSSRQALRSDAALIELINMSDISLDVKVGEGATSLKPGERMLAGVQPGLVPVKVMGQDVPTGALEGDLEIAGGRHYELAFAYDVPPPAPPEGAAAPTDEHSTIEPGAPTAAKGAEGKPAPVKAAPASSSKGSKPGKVEIGRKRH